MDYKKYLSINYIILLIVFVVLIFGGILIHKNYSINHYNNNYNKYISYYNYITEKVRRLNDYSNIISTQLTVYDLEDLRYVNTFISFIENSANNQANFYLLDKNTTTLSNNNILFSKLKKQIDFNKDNQLIHFDSDLFLIKNNTIYYNNTTYYLISLMKIEFSGNNYLIIDKNYEIQYSNLDKNYDINNLLNEINIKRSRVIDYNSYQLFIYSPKGIDNSFIFLNDKNFLLIYKDFFLFLYITFIVTILVLIMICSNIIKINKNDLQNKDSSNLVEKENSDKEDTEQELQKVNDNLDDIMNENFALHESVKLLKDRLLKLDEYSCNLSRDSKNKSDFMSMLSHELRTSLNCIMSFSDMIRSEMLGQIDNKKYLEYAQDIYDSSTHMLLIINNILDISKAEAGKLELNESIVNIKDLINFAIKNVSNMANRKNINIKKFYERGTENIFIDELLFRQIMINLLSNSIKFSNKNDEVNIEVYKNDNGLYISVIDNGIGISEENIPLVLEKFNQEKHEKLNVKGTGIGLPLVKILVELHNGILKIESKKGEGTKVTIQLSLDLIR